MQRSVLLVVLLMVVGAHTASAEVTGWNRDNSGTKPVTGFEVSLEVESQPSVTTAGAFYTERRGFEPRIRV